MTVFVSHTLVISSSHYRMHHCLYYSSGKLKVRVPIFSKKLNGIHSGSVSHSLALRSSYLHKTKKSCLGVATRSFMCTLRHPDSHQGGFWEFPGGKVEEGESVYAALQREIQEELDLSISAAFPFVKIRHDYGDKRVLLDVWQVTAFSGKAIGREGQEIQWLPTVDMQVQDFPAANRRIIDLLKLPLEIAITPELQQLPALSEYLEKVAAANVKLIQLRQKQLPPDTLLKWASHAGALCERLGLRMALNASVDMISRLDRKSVV